MAKSSNFSILADVELNLDGIEKQLKNTNLKFGTDGVDNAADKIKNLSNNMEEASLTFNAANEIFSKTIDIIQSLAEQVYELDSSIIEFQKVSDLSGQSLDNYVKNLSKVGQTVGRTASEMVDAATEFKKSGYTDEDSALLAEIATKYQNVADDAISASDASSFIIAQMKAFDIEAENAISIIDELNEVSNNYAVSSSQLAQGLGIVSSALSVGGNNFQQVLGLMTAGTEITRNSTKMARGE